MMLSKQSIEILLDLVEIKISAMHIHDREDARELIRLRGCREELLNERSRRLKRPVAGSKSPEKPRASRSGTTPKKTDQAAKMFS